MALFFRTIIDKWIAAGLEKQWGGGVYIDIGMHFEDNIWKWLSGDAVGLDEDHWAPDWPKNNYIHGSIFFKGDNADTDYKTLVGRSKTGHLVYRMCEYYCQP